MRFLTSVAMIGNDAIVLIIYSNLKNIHSYIYNQYYLTENFLKTSNRREYI
jgi:hypothetical protein